MHKKYLLIFLCLFSAQALLAQINFQKIFRQPDSASSMQTYDCKATPDGGYILAGLSSEGSTNTFHPYLLKLNCKGEEVWKQVFGTTQTTGNVYTKVIVTQDSGFAMISNLGVYTNYNGFVVRTDNLGNILWQKNLNLSSGNDNVHDIKETSDSHFIISASVKSTPDVGLIKLDDNGVMLWCKTFGNANEYDEGHALIETSDGGYLITGRYISMGTFNAFLLKTDTSGALQWIKCYGDTLQHMWGMDVKEMGNGDYVMCGSTTLLKPNYQSWTDNYLMRLNHSGDTLWSRIFYGSPDQFENAANIQVDAQENIILGVATASYPTIGFVANKHAVAKFGPNGNLIKMNTYNAGSSHYPRVYAAPDGGYVLSGFSTAYTGPVGFQTLIIKMDSSLNSGCNQTNVTAITTVTNKSFKITSPIPITGVGGSSTNNTSSYTMDVIDSTMCAAFPIVQASFSPTVGCAGVAVNFQAQQNGLSTWLWDFGDLNSSTDTSSAPNPSYTYPAGNYTVTLIVGNGCEFDTLAQTIQISAPITQLGLGSDLVICEDSTAMIGTNVLASNYSWNTGDTTAYITVSLAGQYILQASTPCGIVSDTILITTIKCDTIPEGLAPDLTIQTQCIPPLPNAFSPNGDRLNDEFRALIPNNQSEIDFKRMEIYNRLGQLVFATQDVKQSWDGRLNGKDLPVDTYYYFIRYRCRQTIRVFKGDVILIR